MERHVKERLVGAAVLMAAAIILIPEMLSGPERRAPDSQAKADTPLKTYTIDLQQPQAKPATTVIEEPAPPPEQTAPVEEPIASTGAASSQAIPESTPALTREASPTGASSKPEPQPSNPLAIAPAAATSPPAVSNPPAPAPTVGAAKSGRWAVQLGSFSKEETAKRLADELRKDGRDAFVMPVRSGAATLYRVRVGPMSDRASAEAALSQLKAKSPGAAVVSHP